VIGLVLVLLVAGVVAFRLRANLPREVAVDAPLAPDGEAKTMGLRWTSPPLDGQIYARPVLAGDLVIVATENNSLYGLDPTSGRVVWGPTHVGNATPLKDLERQGKPEGCGNIDPLGITGAPGVDAATGSLFAVAEVLDDPSAPPKHVLVGVRARTGEQLFPPVVVDPPGADTKYLQQRPAIAVANGRAYVAFGGLAGDCGTYHGWVVAVPTTGTEPPAFYQVAAEPASNWGGAIWAPAGPSIDERGNVYVATGNSFEPPPDPAFDRGDAVIELTPTLQEVGFWAPKTYREDNELDADLGSTSPLLLPGNLVFQVGKSGTAYLIGTRGAGANPLGGIGGEIDQTDLCPSYGGSAFRAPLIYAACTSGMHGVQLDTQGSTPELRVVWRARVAATGPPVVAGDVVWATDPANHALYGLDASTGAVRHQRRDLGSMTRFSTPTISGDTVVVASGATIVALTP
jgi:outer membrane protein assembly factor BamB